MKQILVIIFIVFIYCSCTKHANNTNSIGCINQIFRSKNELLVPTDDYNTAINLFNLNSINHSNYQVYSVRRGTSPVDGNWISVCSREYVNSLAVFNSSVTYYFRQNGQIDYNFGYQYSETYFQVDTIPSLTLIQVKALWIDAVKNYYNGAYSTFQDSCVNATFGYIDTAYNTSPGNNNLVKAWYVTPTNRSSLIAVFYDNNGKTYAFSNGIID